MTEKIRFRDLSIWLKIAAIIGWLYFGVLIFYFLLGIIEGIFGMNFNI